MLKIILSADLESLPALQEFVSARAAESGFSPRKIKEAELAVEEAVVNIIQHAYPAGKGDVELRWSAGEGPGLFALEIEDRGVPFDLLSAADPDIQSGMDDRKIGGLGIFFIKTLVPRARYRREGDRNILTLILECGESETA